MERKNAWNTYDENAMKELEQSSIADLSPKERRSVSVRS